MISFYIQTVVHIYYSYYCSLFITVLVLQAVNVPTFLDSPDFPTEAAIRYEESILDIILLILVQHEQQLFPVRLEYFRQHWDIYIVASYGLESI